MGTVVLRYPITAHFGVEVKAKLETAFSVVSRFGVLHVSPGR